MSNYVKSTNFAIKDSLVTTDPAKVIKGTDIDNEYNAISNAIASKADTNSPALTGTPSAPTASYGTNTTQLATTSFVQAGLAGLVPSGIITLWSGSIASVPAGWAFCNGTSGTPDLRDRFVVGAGSSYAVGATGGANTVTLDATMIPSHTHTITATGTSGNASADHTHSISGSGTTSGHSNDHTHSGTTGTESVGHTHTFSGVSGVMNSNALHSHTISDPGHSHGLNNLLSGTNSGATGRTDGAQATANTSTSAATTGISVNTANIEHTHSYSGTTAGTSVSHTHAITTGGVSLDHTHTWSFSGTSGNMSATHNHTISVSATAANTGGGLAHENRPPYFALAYIMKL